MRYDRTFSRVLHFDLGLYMSFLLELVPLYLCSKLLIERAEVGLWIAKVPFSFKELSPSITIYSCESLKFRSSFISCVSFEFLFLYRIIWGDSTFFTEATDSCNTGLVMLANFLAWKPTSVDDFESKTFDWIVFSSIFVSTGFSSIFYTSFSGESYFSGLDDWSR